MRKEKNDIANIALVDSSAVFTSISCKIVIITTYFFLRCRAHCTDHISFRIHSNCSARERDRIFLGIFQKCFNGSQTHNYLLVYSCFSETGKKSGDGKKSFFEFKVPRVTAAAPDGGGGKNKNYVVQTIEVDGPLEYDFGRVLELINGGFFEDDDGGGGRGQSYEASPRFTSKFPIVLPPSTA